MLDSEEDQEHAGLSELETNNSPDEIPFEVNGEQHIHKDSNIFTLQEEPDNEDESKMADEKKRRKKKEKKGWVQSTLGGLFEDKTKK